MKKLITLAVFTNVFDVKYNLLKKLLDEAGISYITGNENASVVKPMPYMTPTNVSIDIKVYNENIKEASEILKSIS